MHQVTGYPFVKLGRLTVRFGRGAKGGSFVGGQTHQRIWPSDAKLNVMRSKRGVSCPIRCPSSMYLSEIVLDIVRWLPVLCYVDKIFR